MNKAYQEDYNNPYDDMSDEDFLREYSQEYSPQNYNTNLGQEQQLSQSPYNGYQDIGQTQAKPYNPYYDGIREAIKSYRESTKAEKEGGNSGLKALLAFNQSLASQPRGDTRADQWANFGQALGPAASAYIDEEESERRENEAILKQILEQKKIEDDRLMQAAYKKYEYEKDMAAKLEATRHHRAMEDIGYQNIIAKQLQNQGMSGPNGEIPLTQEDRKKQTEEYGKLLETLKQTDSLAQDYGVLRNKIDSQGLPDPMTPIGSLVNKGTNIISSFSNSKGAQKVRDYNAELKAFKSNSNAWMAEAEKALLGGGQLTPEKIKIMKQLGIYANFDEHNAKEFASVLAARRKDILNKIKEKEEVLSLGYYPKAHSTTSSVEPTTIIEGTASKPANNTDIKDVITVRSPKGNVATFPAAQAEVLLKQKGYARVK